ncbi:MAG: ABC-2 family transporter protein [Anaerolineales bacterium]|nr:ABC-2 family transporter protein [Anaerolineales bacterium]
MRYLRLIDRFIKVSFVEEVSYRANFWINLLHSLLNLITGVLGVYVIFGQIDTLRGWSYAETLSVLGVYLTIQALRNLFIGPSLDALAGMDGEVWSGNLDFTLLRPMSIQFLASFRRWRLFALFDLLLGLGVLVYAAISMDQALSISNIAMFLLTLLFGAGILYAILLAFSALVFWSPGVMFMWIFDGVFQLARYPLGLYPGWVRLALTWIIPVGVITTIPAQALRGGLSMERLAFSLVMAVILILCASIFFRAALRRYASASS